MMLDWIRATPPRVGSRWEYCGSYGSLVAVVTKVENGRVYYRWPIDGSNRSIRSFRAAYTEIEGYTPWLNGY